MWNLTKHVKAEFIETHQRQQNTKAKYNKSQSTAVYNNNLDYQDRSLPSLFFLFIITPLLG